MGFEESLLLGANSDIWVKVFLAFELLRKSRADNWGDITPTTCG
jgi:hypothetical protein